LLPQTNLPLVTWEVLDDIVREVIGPSRLNFLQEGREVDRAYTIPGLGRFRASVFLSKAEVRAILRVVPLNIASFEELGLPSALEKLSAEKRGLIMVTGITGSGKSTTLAAMIDYMNNHRNDHVLTIEDPIEFVHEDKGCIFTQRELGQDSLSFSQALRSALRQDPDVILVGEMRDQETMSTAITAAETGHLVLSTMHTVNATETVNRILSMFPPDQGDQVRLQVAGVLLGVVSQRLLERADGTGRIPAVELMLGTSLIRECIRDAAKTASIPSVIAQGRTQYGMQTFDQSVLDLYQAGTIGYEAALAGASNPDDFALKARGFLSTSDLRGTAALKDAPKVNAKGPAGSAPRQ
ncbi:MAG: PilT/PilU family type 4a pilus ATPase, partial [Candidatus Rokubacteria bacterium]|nr:PilT/PilU family type 4a pilus ATPase [Candidatus Rokubacteria bacterium]